MIDSPEGVLWDQAPTAVGLDVFLNGDCWALAWHAAQLLSAPVFTLGNMRRWNHMVVKVNDGFLDIEGIATADELEHRWGQQLRAVKPSLMQRVGLLQAAYDVDFVHEIGHREANGVALALLALHVPNF